MACQIFLNMQAESTRLIMQTALEAERSSYHIWVYEYLHSRK